MSSTLIQGKPLYNGLLVTREEYLDLEDDGYKYDMKEGVLTMSPSPNFDHAERQGSFYNALKNFLKNKPVGRVVNDVDVFLPDGGDVLRPDISFILNENMGIVKTHIHGAPDLICEILSDSTRDRDLGEKADRYLKNGVKEYWIIDPKKKSIELWQNCIAHWEKSMAENLTSGLLKDLIIKRDDIFS